MIRHQKGAALLAVLWLTVILTFIAGALASTVRTEVEATRNQVDRERGYFLARGAIQAAALELTSPPVRPEEAEKQFGRRELLFEFETGSARVELQPEVSKFNLNAMPALILARLLFQLAVPEAEARSLAVIIRARADKVLFQRLEELLDMPGMTPEIFYGGFRNGARRPALEDVLSLRRAGMAVDVNYAAVETLASLPGMDEQSAAAVDEARRRRPFRNLDEAGTVAPALRSPDAMPFVTLGGQGPMTLLAHGRARDTGLDRTIRATVEIDRQEISKMRILEWRE